MLFDNNAFGLRADKFQGASIPGKPFAVKNNGKTATWGELATCGALQLGVSADCDGVPNNNVRYDTPVISGFSASASWGEDDVWAIAGRYAGEFNAIKLAAAIAYTESTDGAAITDIATGASFRRQSSGLQAGVYVQHIPTGLFVYGAYGKDFNSNLLSPGEIAFTGVKKKDGDNIYLKAGVRTRLSPLGHTVVFGEYGENTDKMSIDLFVNQNVRTSNLQQWGLGVVQEIDQAAMSVWFVYRNFSADVSGDNGFKLDFADLQLFKVGALINF